MVIPIIEMTKPSLFLTRGGGAERVASILTCYTSRKGQVGLYNIGGHHQNNGGRLPDLIHNTSPTRHICSYKEKMKQNQWKFLHQEMIDYFLKDTSVHNHRDSSVDISAQPWPRFARPIDLDQDQIGATINKFGSTRRICLQRAHLDQYAFDEPDAHLSYLFRSRLFRIHIGDITEECVVTKVVADPVEKYLYSVTFARHVPGHLTVVDLPLSLVGMLAAPAFLQGYHIELATPTVKIELLGPSIVPPFQVDVSRLRYIPPYAAMTLRDIQHLLPADGTTRFHRDYDLDTKEIVWAYETGTLPEQALPADYVDPNFLDKRGNRIALTYRNYFPKQ